MPFASHCRRWTRRRFPRPFNCHSYTTPLSYLSAGPSFSQEIWYSIGEVSAHRAFNAPQDAWASWILLSQSIFPSKFHLEMIALFRINWPTHDNVPNYYICRAMSKISRRAMRFVEKAWEMVEISEDLRDLSALSLSLSFYGSLADNRSREAR